MFLFIFAAVLFLVLYSMFKYRVLWEKTKLSSAFYWLIQLALTAVLMYCMLGNYDRISYPFPAVPMLFASAAVFIILSYSAVLFIVRDIFLISAKLLKRSECRAARMLKSRKCTAAILISTFVLSIIGYVNMGIVRVTEYSVDIAKPSVNDKLEIVMLSDAHIGTAVDKNGIDEIVAKINDMKPDAVFLAGDLFDENPSEEHRLYMPERFSAIKSKYGVYFSYGNHEGYLGEDISGYFKQAGITVLEDEAVTIAGDISVIGRKDLSAEPEDLESLMKRYSINTESPVIVLNHQPSELKEISDSGADLTLCGHTHGEQFPLTEALVSLANDMVYGVEKFDSMTAVTSSGIGGWGVHFKFPAKSELVKITLNFNNQLDRK